VWDSLLTNMNIMASNLASNSSYSRIVTVYSGQVLLQEDTHTHTHARARTYSDNIAPPYLVCMNTGYLADTVLIRLWTRTNYGKVERGNEKSLRYVTFEIFATVTMKNTVFWDVTPCGSCKNLRFEGTWRLHHQGNMNP
jgi:hypothetical protein